jgi:hypothetical protein
MCIACTVCRSDAVSGFWHSCMVTTCTGKLMEGVLCDLRMGIA